MVPLPPRPLLTTHYLLLTTYSPITDHRFFVPPSPLTEYVLLAILILERRQPNEEGMGCGLWYAG